MRDDSKPITTKGGGEHHGRFSSEGEIDFLVVGGRTDWGDFSPR